jgi:hypothetical protein
MDPALCVFWSKGDTGTTFGTTACTGDLSVMDDSAQKLRSLARQSRALSAVVPEAGRAQSLQSLARLYERQAFELEANSLTAERSLTTALVPECIG